MAMTACWECKEQISKTAKVCPKCGAKKKRRYLLKGLLLMFGLILVGNLVVSPPPRQAATPLTPEQQATKERDDAVVQRGLGGAIALKQSARNPDSFKLEKALIMESGTICYEYRAQNGFGGINVGNAVLRPTGDKLLTDTMDGFKRTWDSECAEKPYKLNAAPAIRRVIP